MQFVYEFSIKVTDFQEKFDALKLHMQMKTLKLGYCSLIIELIYHLAYVYMLRQILNAIKELLSIIFVFPHLVFLKSFTICRLQILHIFGN